MNIQEVIEWANQVGVKQHELEKENAELKAEVEDLNKRVQFYKAITSCYNDICAKNNAIIEHLQNQLIKE